MLHGARCPACDHCLPPSILAAVRVCPNCSAKLTSRDRFPWPIIILLAIGMLASAPLGAWLVMHVVPIDLLAYPLATLAFICIPLLFNYMHSPFTAKYQIAVPGCPKCHGSIADPPPKRCPQCDSVLPPPPFTDWLRGGPFPGRRHLVIAAAIVAFVLLMAIAMPDYLRQRATSNWPSVQGTVVDVQMPVKGGARSEPFVRYRYQVAGVTYESQHASLMTRFTPQPDTALLRTLQKNSPVTVYYSPRNPAEATLINGLQEEPLWLFRVGLILETFCLFCSALVFADFIHTRRRLRTPLRPMLLDWRKPEDTIAPVKLVCPNCATPIPTADTNVETGIAKCAKCNEVINVFEALGLPNPSSSQVPSDEPVPRPANMKEQDLGPVSWSVRWRWFTSGTITLFFFCIGWDAFLAFWYFNGIARGDWFMLIFPIAHLAIGIYLTYSVIAQFLNTTCVAVTSNDLIIRHRPIFWTGNRRIPIATINQLYCKRREHRRRGQSFYTYDLCLHTSDQQSIRLLSFQTYDESRFLGQQIESRLNIRPHPIPGEYRE